MARSCRDTGGVSRVTRPALDKLSDLATKGDIVQAITHIVLPLTHKIDELEQRLLALEPSPE